MVKVRASSTGYYPVGHRREAGEVFDYPDDWRLGMWMDPVDPSVKRPAPKNGLLFGRASASARESLRAAQALSARKPPDTLSALARGDAGRLTAELAASLKANADLTAMLEQLTARLASLEASAKPVLKPVAAEEDLTS